MHRSRPFVLVALAAAAACSKHDPSDENDLLSQDRSLAARIRNDESPRPASLPGACGTVTVAAAPSAANQQQAEALTRQAGIAEMHGDLGAARSLLQRASALDGTNKSAAYHLGRTSEALGDRASAMTAYCRYLALAPTTADSVEARQRLAAIARSAPRTTASATGSKVAPRRAVATRMPRPARYSPSIARSRVAVGPTVRRSEPATSATPTSNDVGRTAGGDVVATSRPVPTPAPAPTRTQRRSTIGAQSTVIGVAAGAILGAATGRSVKSAVIGAAAGGVLGTVVGATTRPAGRGTRS